MASRDFDEGIRPEFAPPCAARHAALGPLRRLAHRCPEADEHRFLVVALSVEIYGRAARRLVCRTRHLAGADATRKKPTLIIKEIPVPAADPFVADETRVRQLGITARELEILGLIAAGLSNREIAARLFVSKNTVKTHSSRLFDKLGAKRRTQAVQIGKTARLIP